MNSAAGIDFDFENKQSFNKLIIAVVNGNEKEVKKLLKQNWNPNSTDNVGRTAVHLASRSAKLHNILKLLLEYGGLPDHATHSGATALCLAAYAGTDRNVSLLLDCGASINVRNSSEASPLHFACNGTSFETVKLLVQAGANVNSTDVDNVTPLMLAVTNRQVDTIRYLLDNGADTLVKDSQERTVYHQACSNDDIELFEILIKRIPNLNDVCNMVDSEGWTLLMIAAQYGSIQITQRLIQLGSDTTKTNDNGLIALHLAAHNSLECFKLLLDSTPVEIINAQCVFSPGGLNNSLPCLLIDKFCLEGLKLLFNKPGIHKDVFMCPLIKDNRICPPVPFTFYSATCEFASIIVQLYIDNKLPLDPQFPDFDKILTCIESLLFSHVSLNFRLPNNAEAQCRCAKLFVVLLENDASPDPCKVMKGLDSNFNLWFFCNHGSIFGLSFLLKHSNFLEPHIILKLFTKSLVEIDAPITEKNAQSIKFLCKYCRPWDINECKLLAHSQSNVYEKLNSLFDNSFSSNPFPTLKFLCRVALRDYMHDLTSSLPQSTEGFEGVQTFKKKLNSLLLPKNLLSYLQYDELVLILKSRPDYPSFTMSL